MGDNGRTVIAIGSGSFGADDSAAPDPTITIEHVDASSLDDLARLDCDALVVGLQRLGASELAALPPRVRVVGRAGIGLDSIDLDAAERLGIAVVHQPGYATTEVAEHATALIYAVTRSLHVGDGIARSAWPSWDRFGGIPSLGESTLGLVGFGRIGRAVAERMRPAVARILIHDPLADDLPAGVQAVGSLAELLGESDIVSLHAPLTAQTEAMIDREALATMRPGSFLVNVSRGGLLDEEAVADALRSGRLAGAGLDVLAVEPPAPDNPLLAAPRTLITPHIAWLSKASKVRLRTWTLLDVANVFNGGAPTHGRLAVPGDAARRSGTEEDEG